MEAIRKVRSDKGKKRIVKKLTIQCIRCSDHIERNTITERNRDRTIGECAYVCDTCVDDEEEYCYQQFRNRYSKQYTEEDAFEMSDLGDDK